MEYRIRTDLARSILVVGVAIGLSVTVSAAVAARAYRGRGEDTVRDGHILTVKGLARIRIRSDVAVWKIGIEGEAQELRGAFDELERGLRQVRSFLDNRGFSQEEIAVGAIDTEVHHRQDEESGGSREVVGYTLARWIRVTSAEVGQVASAAGEVTQLIRDGVLVVSRAPEFYYARLADLKIELMGLASRDARARAVEIATNAGSSVRPVRSARMGVLQITAPHSTEVTGYGIHDTSTIEKDVRAVVTVTFQVER